LIAVQDGTPLYATNSINQPRGKFPGITEIVEIWFTNYKGPGVTKSMGYNNKERVDKIMQTSIEAFHQE